ncbi:MAG: carboxypeptidase regulatory-like domain-containing protein [Bryobacteraceae bacterium]|nr:carboxypeptidase regulatory-like domain-containing protein [Bryobacteraceae bacterium]
MNASNSCFPARVAFLILCLTLPGVAQTTEITGRVTDSSQAVLVGVPVTARNTETGLSRVVKTNESGYYSVPLLPRGKYSVSLEMAGFRPETREQLELNDGQSLRIDFELIPGAVEEAITVRAEALQMQSETPALNTVITNQRILDLPLNGRNPLALATLAPGVRPIGSFGGLVLSAFGGARVSIGGGSPSTNNVMVDGVAAEQWTSGGPQVVLSTDATEEFRIVTRLASAEYGRTGGGIISFVSKNGTNEFHGSLFEFVRNKVFNANDFFSNTNNQTRTPFVFNQFGATVGGPIIPRKTFFCFNWEKVAQRTLARTLRTLPTQLQRQGDFSQTFDSSGRLIAIYDPLTTRLDPANPGRRIRTAFPGNVIPPNRLNAVAQAVQTYYPQPNATGERFTGVNNFRGEASSPTDKDIYGIRIDHNFTDSRRSFARYTNDNTCVPIANYYDNIAEAGGSDACYPRFSGVVTYTEALRPTLLLDLRGGINSFAIDRTPRSFGFDVTEINLPAAINDYGQTRRFPFFNIGDVAQVGGNEGDLSGQVSYTTTWAGSLTWIKGRHTVKTGAENRIYQWNSKQGTGIFRFDFDRNFTNGPDPSSATVNGFGYASFLLGYPASSVIYRYSNPTYVQKHYGIYLQDDWKATPRLTLNLGLRWEYEGGVTDRFNAISNFDPNSQTTVQGVNLRGGLVFPGTGGLSRGHREPSLTDFGPRAGASYQITKKTVVRAGYGIFHLPTTGIFVNLGSTGFGSATPYIATIDGFIPAGSLSNPYPDGIILPSGSRNGTLTGLGQAIGGNQRGLKRGYSQQWSASVQQQLPGGWLVETAYLGNRGVSLPANRSFNYLPEAALALGPGLQQVVPNPYQGIITAGPLANAQVTRATLSNAYPQFSSVTGLDNWADSIYHAGSVRVEKRFSGGLSMLASWTWSKLIDNNVGNGSNDFNSGGSNSVQNWDNLRAERALSTSDVPHYLSVAGSYALPFGKSGHPLYRRLAAGWQVNGFFTAASGNVISVTANAPAFGGNRPNVTGDPTPANQSIDNWLNRAAFTNIPAFTYGNAPRNLPRTRTDALFSLDSSVSRSFDFNERVRMQFRAEAFNTFNRATFGTPGTNINAQNFGLVRTLREGTGPRQLQLALKLYF